MAFADDVELLLDCRLSDVFAELPLENDGVFVVERAPPGLGGGGVAAAEEVVGGGADVGEVVDEGVFR